MCAVTRRCGGSPGSRSCACVRARRAVPRAMWRGRQVAPEGATGDDEGAARASEGAARANQGARRPHVSRNLPLYRPTNYSRNLVFSMQWLLALLVWPHACAALVLTGSVSATPHPYSSSSSDRLHFLGKFCFSNEVSPVCVEVADSCSRSMQVFLQPGIHSSRDAI